MAMSAVPRRHLLIVIERRLVCVGFVRVGARPRWCVRLKPTLPPTHLSCASVRRETAPEFATRACG